MMMHPERQSIAKIEGKSIALVGNAQSLFTQGLGKEIDAHDIVCRINAGSNVTQPEHQGIRTDFAFIGALKFFSTDVKALRAKNVPIFHVTPRYREHPLSMESGLFIPEAVTHELNEILGYTSCYPTFRPSTGITVIHYILNYCKPAELKLFGFDCKQTKTYYNVNERWKPGMNVKPPHDWEKERLYLVDHNMMPTALTSSTSS